MRLVLVASVLSLAAFIGAQTDARALLRGDEIRRTVVLKDDPARYVPLMVQALRDDDPVVRRNAALALRRLELALEDEVAGRGFQNEPSPEEKAANAWRRAAVIAALTATAREGDKAVRETAVRSLVGVLRERPWGFHGEIGGSEKPLRPLIGLGDAAIPVLLDVLRRDEDYAARISALRVLARRHRPAILDGLLDIVDSERGYTAFFAMRAAMRYNDPRVVRTILANADKGAADYAGNLGKWVANDVKPWATPELVRQLQGNPNAPKRALAARLLGHVLDPRARVPLTQALRDPDENVRASSAAALVAYPDSSLLLPLIASARADSAKVQAGALSALGSLRDPRAFETVVQALNAPGLDVRAAAVGALARIDGERAIPYLLAASDESLNHALVQALRPLRNRRAASILLRIFETEKGPDARDAALALAEMDARETIPALVRRLDADSGYDAVEALARFGRAATEALLDGFNEAQNRDRLVLAFGETRDPRVVELLLRLIDDPGASSTHSDAIQALGRMGDHRAVEPLVRQLISEKEYRPSAAAEALGELGAVEAFGPLLAAMERPETAKSAATALARIGDPRALEPLLAFLKQTDVEEWDGLEWMGNFHDPRVLALLLNELDWDAAVDAANGLGRLGDPKALPALRKAAQSDDRDLATAARAAIARLTGRSFPD